jgi:uncharacterized protein DUF4160
LPRISEFYGIAIYMYYSDHPPPHFHAIYGADEAVIAIGSNRVLAGSLPRRALSLVREWGRLRRDDLLMDWKLARDGQPLRRIDPIE